MLMGASATFSPSRVVKGMVLLTAECDHDPEASVQLHSALAALPSIVTNLATPLTSVLTSGMVVDMTLPDEPEPVAAPTPSMDAPEPVAAPSPSEASMDGSIVMALATPPDAPEEPVQPPRFAVGARVEARFEAGETWYAGVIERVDGDAYDVAYDDGDREKNVEARLIRKLPLSSLDIAKERGHSAVVALLEEHQK